MKKLFAFGDSYTYGHGLEDCYVLNGNIYNPGPEPSQLAWPALLGKDLDCEVYNNGAPGASNIAILHRILNTNFTEDSVCVIMWSYPNRDMIFNDNYVPLKALFNRKPDINNVSHVGSWREDMLSKDWMLTHNATDLIMRSWLHIHHANLFLERLNVPHYNVFAYYTEIKDYKPVYCKIPFKDVYAERFIDYALDGSHPGPLTQVQVAKDIKQALIEDSII